MNKPGATKKQKSIPEYFRLNGVRFNVLFGLLYMGASPFLLNTIDLRKPDLIVGLIGLLLYVGEFWAFNFKTAVMRGRVLMELTGGNPGKRAEVPGVGCMVTYGFIMRLCFRMMLLIFSLMAMGIVNEGSDPPWYAITILVIAVLFELFALGYPAIEGRIWKDDEETPEEREKGEREWRTKNIGKLNDPKLELKEAMADFILVVVAFMFTHSFWTMSNSEFIAWIDRSSHDGENPWIVLLTVGAANFVLCLFMLVPIRLAFWVGESLSAIDPVLKRRLRWSFLFAGISITSPVLEHFFSVYLF